MSKIWANTARRNPGLHVWREGTPLAVNLRPETRIEGGWVGFDYDFEPLAPERVGLVLFDFDALGAPANFEGHQRFLQAAPQGEFPAEAWFTEGTSKALFTDPRAASRNTLKVHLISLHRYRPCELFLWTPGTGHSRKVAMKPNYDALGPVFEIALNDLEKSFLNFKFIRKSGEFEPDFVNRLWSAQDGGEIWTHSEAAEITGAVPAKKNLTMYFRQELDSPAEMRVWQLNSDYAADVPSAAEQNGWSKFETPLYTNMRYGLHFWNRALPEKERWERPAAKRELRIDADRQYWTLEGSNHLFSNEPHPNGEAKLTLAVRPPFSKLQGALTAEVRVDQARATLCDLPVPPDHPVTIKGYLSVRTMVRFKDSAGRFEEIDGHPIVLTGAPQPRDLILERPPSLARKPPADLFKNPPFTIRRPGVYEEGDALHFILHAPDAARVDLIAEWTNWRDRPITMHSTEDGTYWWTRLAKAELLRQLGRTEYHGAKYRFLFDETTELQDPAAGWVESSRNSAASLLIDPSNFAWQDTAWQRPGFDYYTIYQLHPARFTNRHGTLAPLRQVAREIDAGWLKDLGITAVLLLPLNEVGSNNGWGYDPAFFYAIEHSYGGPDALKEFVDTCHKNGLAVLVDVVFNHAGSIDNILWAVARRSFFDGDTGWGSMINFDHPQCRHFFAQNLAYLAREFHIDGFRLDHTYTILHSHEQNWYVREPGSGGGWDFMHALRETLHSQVDSRALLMAEHLPNEWNLTNFGGPMDTQWCDHFHDRIVAACKGQNVMPALADALKLTHTHCDGWYKATNYAESHDEVGNVRDRVTYIAGWKNGLRMAKVAATATLLSRGLPMFFMGGEAGEDAQFTNGSSTMLDLKSYETDPDRRRIRDWWMQMLALRRSPLVTGPSPLEVRFAQDQRLAFTRGQQSELFVLLNFGGTAGWKSLAELNLPGGIYCELWNSTWPAFAIAGEDEREHKNWGREARLTRGNSVDIPDYGVLILRRTDVG